MRCSEIFICNQWQFVKDNEEGLRKKFWASKNVHFGGEPADKLREFLAANVLKLMKGK